MSELKLTIPNDKWIRGKIQVKDDLSLYDTTIRVFCAVENKYIPSAEKSLLCYYAKYGVTTDTDKIYADDYNRTKQMVSNLKYKLTQLGFLEKDEDSNSWKLPYFLRKTLDELTIILKLDIKNA